MTHWAIQNLGSLNTATDDMLENAVDQMVDEAQWDTSIDGRVNRAEGLAVLSHEFRRRNSSPSTEGQNDRNDI